MRRLFVVGLLTLIAHLWPLTSHAIVVSLDEFSITRNGVGVFTDSFTDGNEPPSAPNFDGVPHSYSVLGSFPNTAESGGQLLVDSANGALTFNAVGQPRLSVGALLLTNANSSNLGAGLKSDDTLSLQGIFSLTTPPGPQFSIYAIVFTDTTGASGTHQLVQLQVSFNVATQQPIVAYVLQDFDADQSFALGSTPFAPPVGADQILLQIDRPDTSNDNFFGSFSYLSSGSVVGGGSFSTPAQLFQGEEFVRARFFVSQDLPAVPEPSTWLLLATGLVSLLGYGWRKRRQAV